MKTLSIFRSEALMQIALVSGTIVTSSHASAQANPPKVHQKVVDEFGVERKTGRFGLSIPILLSIGQGDAQLTSSYGYVDGADLQQNVPAWVRYNYSVYNGKTGKYFDYITVELDGGSDTFRRESGTTVAYNAEYASGSTLSTINNNVYYVNKYGTHVTVDGSGFAVDYPDGRQIKLFRVSSYNYSPSSYIDFMGNSPDQTLVNNFGFMIKITRGAYARAVLKGSIGAGRGAARLSPRRNGVPFRNNQWT